MKTYIVIGGSSGIGFALVNLLLNSNNVINISRTKPNINNANLTHFTCDALKNELPKITHADGLIYCPGSINLKPFERLNIEDFKHDFEINVLGAVKAIQTYLPILKKGVNSSIVLFSTVATALGMPFHTSIATSKSGIEGLVKSLAAELAPNIRINAIAPTVTNTPLASKLLRNDRMVETITERHPLKKILSPEEVASMAEYLISEKAESISGQIFKLDSGIVTLKI